MIYWGHLSLQQSSERDLNLPLMLWYLLALHWEAGQGEILVRNHSLPCSGSAALGCSFEGLLGTFWKVLHVFKAINSLQDVRVAVGNKKVLTSSSPPTLSSVQLQPYLARLSAMCEDFTREKQASLAAVQNPILINIHHRSHKLITQASGNLLKTKGSLIVEISR